MKLVPAILFLGLLAACGRGSGTSPALPLQPGARSAPIAEIQGDGPLSPWLGRSVIVSGIVTGDFQDRDADEAGNLGGFYIQDDTPDDDPATSEGIFVFDGNNPATDVKRGDRVTVQGTVEEYFGETQVSNVSVTIIGKGSVTATDVDLPAASTMTNSDGDLVADLERYEGMLLRFPQQLTVTDLRNLERFGAVRLSAGGRLFQFTNASDPDPAGYAAHRSSIARRSLELDDGKRSSNPGRLRYLNAGTSPDYSIRTGDTTRGVTGNLRYARGSGGEGTETWRLMPTTAPRFEAANPRPGPPSVAGKLRVASFNVNNFFSAVDNGQRRCGPRGNDYCRGADNDRELGRQLAKIAAALAIMDADIVGLTELENNRSASLQMIVDAVNDRIGGDVYTFVDTGSIHDDAIKTGVIYRPSSVRLFGRFQLLNRGVDARFNDARNRPALAQSFALNASGAVLTVIVNHLKSKGSSCEADGDANRRDGQGNCNQTRTDAATALAHWVETDPTGSKDPDFLVIGDLNAYMREDPLAALQKAGLTNLLEDRPNPYSFMYDGQAGALDHAFASAQLVPQVVEALEWHINADEPSLLDYNLEHGRNPALFNADTPYRASDHDPIIIGLDLVN